MHTDRLLHQLRQAVEDVEPVRLEAKEARMIVDRVNYLEQIVAETLRCTESRQAVILPFRDKPEGE